MAAKVLYAPHPLAENLNNYRPGGYHPVHLGDTFNDGRYTVLHKLGYGSYATVWLVKDTVADTYASLKILTAASTADSREISVLSRLQGEGLGKEYVMQLIDHFQHKGPNGTHQCVVTELLGPNLNSDTEDVYPNEVFPPSVAKRLIAQITLGVSYLHKRNVVHGDIHLGNLMFYSDKIVAALQKGEMETLYGEPVKRRFYLLDDKEAPVPPSPHIPDYWLNPPHHPSALLHLCLDDPSQIQLKIADFSESYILDPTSSGGAAQPRLLLAPDMYRPPEGLIPSIQEARVTSSPATDIWNLAVLFHVLFTYKTGLFLSSFKEDDILCEQVLLLGRLPESLWSRWRNRHQYFDDQGNWIGPPSRHRPLRQFLKFREGEMDDELERTLFETMLRGMVCYESERRMKVDEMMSSEWFGKYCIVHLS